MSTRSRHKAPVSVDYLPTAGSKKDWRDDVHGDSLAAAARSFQSSRHRHFQSSSYPALERLKAAGRRQHPQDSTSPSKSDEGPQTAHATSSDLSMARELLTTWGERASQDELSQDVGHFAASGGIEDTSDARHAVIRKDASISLEASMYAPLDASVDPRAALAHGADHFMTGGGGVASSQPGLRAAAGHGADHFGTGGVASMSSSPALARATPSYHGALSAVMPGADRDDGRFRQKSLIARGGMGEVWRAWDQQHQRWVALKYIHPSLRDDAEVKRRFVREQEALERLQHEHIVRFYEADPQRGLLVMEWVKGPTLRAQLQAQGRLSVWEAVEVGLQIGAALQEAHRHQLIHRDLKPSNIILCQGGPSLRCKLLDFGVAAALDASRVTSSLGGIVGTAYYIDPAQRERGAEAMPAFDIYSLGVLLYEMLTGDVPFAGAASLSESFHRLAVTGALAPNECPDEMKQTFAAQIKELESLYLSAVSRDIKRRISLGHWLLVLKGIQTKLRLAYEKGLRTRLHKIEQLQQQGEARALRRCLDDAIASYPQEGAFARRLALLCRPVPAEVSAIFAELNDGVVAFESLKARWASFLRYHQRPDALVCREIDEILAEREAALEALLADVESLLLSKGPGIALQLLTRHVMASRRWQEQKLVLERSAQNLDTLLANTRKRLARGHSVKRVPHYWREQLQQARFLSPQLLGSPYLRTLLHDFLKEHELYEEIVDDFMTTERRLAFRSPHE